MMHSKIAPPTRTLSNDLAYRLLTVESLADDGDAFVAIAQDMIDDHIERERKADRFVGDEWRRIRAALRGPSDKFLEIEKLNKEFEAAGFPHLTLDAPR